MVDLDKYFSQKSLEKVPTKGTSIIEEKYYAEWEINLAREKF